MKEKNKVSEEFLGRHLGINKLDQAHMLEFLTQQDLEQFVASVVPSEILDQYSSDTSFLAGCSEIEALEELNHIARQNIVNRSLIGLGYYGTTTPSVIKRNILENPQWYTSYTPYQAEISQGRLEALFNFQTLITELTGLEIANASLLDEATAAAEAMSLSFSVRKNKNARTFFVDQLAFPQTLDVLRTRAEPLNIVLQEVDLENFNFNQDVFGILIQLPGSNGRLFNLSSITSKAKEYNLLVTTAIDPLAQVLLEPVGKLGVDIAVGSSQRFGVPMGFGGPHAAFFATRKTFQRQVPGRLVGQSVDRDGSPALRLALQTREQHIRRDKATSNICTAQVLLAVISSFFAVYHGSDGLEDIAKRVVLYRAKLESFLKYMNYPISPITRFDTIEVFCPEASKIHKLMLNKSINLRMLPYGSSIDNATGFAVSLDELTTENELHQLFDIFSQVKCQDYQDFDESNVLDINELLVDVPLRKEPWLTQKVFNYYRSETELLRYINKLSNKDFSLVQGMIPLGSCTMKLNATSELIPISWKEFASIHPFAPIDQLKGYKNLIHDLEGWLAYLTGFAAVSLQPNAGSQGEYAGLLTIRAWHQARGEGNRNLCLIPTSAHGTNPASAVMAGFKVEAILCDSQGNIDINDLSRKVETHSENLAALMITYPSTHGVFEPNICEISRIVHRHNGQVYLDGANLNAQVGLCKPGAYGADVCHLNLHKTFCIPHGGGGPGVGPIAVAKHLQPFLPKHLFDKSQTSTHIGAISAAPYGSAGILPISWMYIKMMGLKGLRQASSTAILSANYIAERLDSYYPVLFKGPNNRVAHECILDLRQIKQKTGIEVDDIAKRLMDYGFHAPTVSWPVAGTLMVEPTESESLVEVDRFCDAMIAIRQEINQIELGNIDGTNNPLKRSPHTLQVVTADKWDRPYSRQEAAFPLEGQVKNKFWPAVSRIDNAFGDRNLVCTCDPIEEYINN